MNYIQDFTDGAIADNILRGLRRCPVAVLYDLKEQKLLTRNGAFPTLEYRSLTYKGIEAYADVTGLPLAYFFFGEKEPPIPTYTPLDGAIIKLCNTLSDKQLDAALIACDAFFPNPLYKYEQANPSDRVIRCLSRFPRGERSKMPIAPYKVIENDIHTFLRHRFEVKNIRWFPTDTFPDLATYLGVSLHWVFGFERHPLFCKNIKAEQLFNRFTLLSPRQYKEFFSMLKYILLGDISAFDHLI